MLFVKRLRTKWTSPGAPGPRYDATAPTAFMHIPKTSGTALTAGLREAIRPRREVIGADRVLFGGFRAFDTFDRDEQGRFATRPSDLAEGDFITGHIAFSTLRERYGSINYITVLREPISRILSHWLFWRTVPDAYLARFGTWADNVRQARKPLEDFLSCSDVACHTDNLSVRMLLWPHPLVPEDDFIDARSDDALMSAAVGALRQFGFADIVENPRMQSNVEDWLGRPVPYPIVNETSSVPQPLQRPLHVEFTPEALALMETRTRLDLKLWTWLGNQRVTAPSIETLRQRSILCNVTRQAMLMASAPDGYAAVQRAAA